MWTPIFTRAQYFFFQQRSLCPLRWQGSGSFCPNGNSVGWPHWVGTDSIFTFPPHTRNKGCVWLKHYFSWSSFLGTTLGTSIRQVPAGYTKMTYACTVYVKFLSLKTIQSLIRPWDVILLTCIFANWVVQRHLWAFIQYGAAIKISSPALIPSRIWLANYPLPITKHDDHLNVEFSCQAFFDW